MSHQVLNKQSTFGAVLTAAVPHAADDDPKNTKPYTVVASYFIEFEGTAEDLAKAIGSLPMVEIVFEQKIAKQVSIDADVKL